MFARLNVLRQYCLLSGRTANFFQWTKDSTQIKYFFSSSVPHSTIFALSSGAGKCGVAVIRLSGSKSSYALKQLCGKVTKPRTASLCKLMNPQTQELLDRALVLWFPGPKSFTGEDCAELHIHGGPAVVSAVLTALGSLSGLTPALPGEFSKRAFANGKLDLTEVEGLGDLIHAETEAQRKQALRQMEGDLNQLYTGWRTGLIKSLANVEAFIDFSEEENIEDDVIELVTTSVMKIQTEMEAHLRDSRKGERLRDGVHAVILGEPNVGKSSLLNFLCQRPAAIVSPLAGTTRDVVETALNIAGYPVLISDTAGLRESCDVIEKEGISRALDRAEKADLKILVLDFEVHGANLSNVDFPTFLSSYLSDMRLYQNNFREADSVHDSPSNSDQSLSFDQVPEDSWEVLVVVNKSDLARVSDLKQVSQHASGSVCFVSCKTGQGLDRFLHVLAGRIKDLCGDPLTSSSSLTQTRHRHHLSRCKQHLEDFHNLLSYDVVIAAEKLRRATRELALITGAVSTEDVLDVIFRDFCIGK
ncbi:tRNA modification GTPase GTPBP3, mitochondrial [Aplysia californica]|uniref:tRNA modification GTPase GTPBP3, mitochondrial n=1 Tax=Aplysia californica TaxID=6500 RepID=A0ABM1VRU4_APLCA|nr:tRNA modification GTPase GTPBP3, mitochondrial [Aplysia californica]XP_035825136.1 tRNA modification GTPase GTPBP3, mitochondrial [Aplysia californica]XP_035825137.1 tRNA modification GTPase GTPBP3, mitochondrial [Aplysia californica]